MKINTKVTLAALSVLIFCTAAFAQNAKDAKELSKCVCASSGGVPACLKELKDLYFKDNKYAELAELLKKLCPGNKVAQPAVDYYVAFSRYAQLKYLEETKGWDEYFAKGNEYREDIVNYTQKAIKAVPSKDMTAVYTKLLVYQFHKDQQDAFVEAALTDLIGSVSDYAQSGADMAVLKEVADKLLAYDEKVKANEVYKMYAAKLAAGQIHDKELKEIAANFYKEGNLELAENIYDIYIQRVSAAFSGPELVRELTGIAMDFVYKDSGSSDPAYAEKLFKKIEEIGGKEAFDEQLLYLRGFNLEKYRDFARAKDVYLELMDRFPQNAHKDELTYKIGLIYTYVLRDISSGRTYFTKLIQKNSLLSYDLAALYQLGLLSQWEGSNAEAKSYYDRLLQKIGDTDPERLALAQERAAEISQGKPLEYNLRMGLDTALKSEYANLDMSKLELKSSLYQPVRGQEATVQSSVLLGPSGCLQVELQYLWSGDTGSEKPAAAKSAFKTSYASAGTKLIVMVLVSPEGITERGIDLIDVR